MVWRFARCAIVALVGAGVLSCGSRQPERPAAAADAPAVHVVAGGDTLYAIGRRYGVSHREIARANDIEDPDRIFVGQRLKIPDAAGLGSGVIGPPVERKRVASGVTRDRAPATVRLRWPVHGGTVTSGFGRRNGTSHDGIDIAAPLGTMVTAAAAGEVMYSGDLPGYGKVIIVGHRDGLATVYAHNQRNDVQEGQRVRRGQRIARVGTSGRTTGANLHFEVRHDNVARDPLRYLPDGDRIDTRHAER